jgi:type III secretion system low calcium response chaperone LcrH/SycD
MMKADETQVKKAVNKIAGKVNAAESHKDKNATVLADEFVRNGHMPKDILNLSDQQIEGLYAQAYNFYQTGRFKDALQIFRLLIMLNANEQKYILGLAACQHMLKEFKNAVDAYTLCSILDPESPIAYYHMSDCFLEMKDPYSAIVALDMAIKRSGAKPEFQMLKDRAKMTMENLQSEVKEKNKM